MGVTPEDLTRAGYWLTRSDKEWEDQLLSVKTVLNCYESNDQWALKIKKNVGILLTSSKYGLPYLKASVESHAKLGYWLVLSYDNFIDPDNNEKDIDYNNGNMPPKDIMKNVDTFLLTHHQTWGGVSYPFIWQLRIASGVFHSFDYVLVNNGDTIIEKPENFNKLIELLGDGDILSSGPTLEREIGTAGILMRSSAFLKIAKHMNDHMVPASEYYKSTQEYGNTEGRLAVAVRELGLKAVVCKTSSCPSHSVCEQLHVPGNGDWYDLIGFRHIHGEMNYAYRYKQIPPETKYLDKRFVSSNDYNASEIYHNTKDIKTLENWWMKE